MSQTNSKHPPPPSDNWNHNPDLAFKLVARNEKARQMWAHPNNTSRYVAPSFVERTHEDQIVINISRNAEDPTKLETNSDTESALQFFFSELPKNPAKGYVMGSDEKPCDVLLGGIDDFISGEMIFFNFNDRHQLIMDIKSDKPTSVKFKGQKQATRARFTWLFPRNRQIIRVKVANRLEFDVVLPDYGKYAYLFHENCVSFLNFAAQGQVFVHSPVVGGRAATDEENVTSDLTDAFYLRGTRLGYGSYGDVYIALRMPDGKLFAAKRFKNKESFELEVKILKQVCEGEKHKNIVHFVGEWLGDRKPTLIMEYVAGGNLLQRIQVQMSVSEIGNLAHQMLQALVFTHDQGVMHRDLKPANILCVSRNRFKLGDFGLATLVGTLVETRGTPQYRAPEVQDLTLYGYPADVFSLGVTLFECLDGLPNYNKPTWHQDLMIDFGRYYRKSRKQRAIMTNAHDSVFIRLVKESILLMKPGERLTARECIEKDRYSWLWTWFSLWEMVDDVEEADVDSLEQMHQDRSFEANSLQSSRLKDLQSSRIEDTGDMTFETISGLKEPLLITLADDNVKRKRESQTSSTPAKDKAEDKTITPNQPTPDISKSPKIDIKPKRGEDDSSITVRAIGSSVREPKRIKFGSI